MSRHRLAAEDQPDLETTVGYDAPLDIFFAQVHLVRAEQETDNDERDDDLLLWIGTNYRELGTVEELGEALADFCPLTEEIRILLLTDRRRETAEPTALQKQMLEFINQFPLRNGSKQKMD